MGDHPVIWTNEKARARNVYIFMGHSPILLDDEPYRRIFSNAIFWAAATPDPPASALTTVPVAATPIVPAATHISGDPPVSAVSAPNR